MAYFQDSEPSLTNEDTRFEVCLNAALPEINSKGTIISISAAGCAIRTTVHLQSSQVYKLKIPHWIDGRLQVVEISVQVIWGHEDHRVDANYRYGLQFLAPLQNEILFTLTQSCLSSQSA